MSVRTAFFSSLHFLLSCSCEFRKYHDNYQHSEVW